MVLRFPIKLEFRNVGFVIDGKLENLAKTIGRLSKDKQVQELQKKYQVYSDPVSKFKEFLVSKSQIFFFLSFKICKASNRLVTVSTLHNSNRGPKIRPARNCGVM